MGKEKKSLSRKSGKIKDGQRHRVFLILPNTTVYARWYLLGFSKYFIDRVYQNMYTNFDILIY